jgi:photosystem II stability/assembly factor-like uncharacterized protein
MAFASATLLTVVGSDLSAYPQAPLLVVSKDGGQSWVVSSVQDVPDRGGYFNASSCTSGVCTAVGQSFNLPLLVISQDGGASWKNITNSVPGLPASGLNASSCTGSGSSAICTAVGQDYTGTQPPLLLSSKDGGTTWAVKSVSDLTKDGYFNATSCTGSGSSAICTAVGHDWTGNPAPLVVSNDGGNTWTLKSVPNLSTHSEFNATSCTGSGSSAICTAAGKDGAGEFPPLLAVSNDGGGTWAIKSVAGLPQTLGTFKASSCTGSGSTAICTAVGRGIGDVSPPYLAVSTDGGTSWALKSVPGLPEHGGFNSISCTGSESSAVCVAAGQAGTGKNPPLLVVSQDGGNTWTMQSLPDLQGSGEFDAVSCKGSGSTAICTASGVDLSDNSQLPLIVMSNDSGLTWTVQSKTIPNLPKYGKFFGASSI